MRDYSRLVKRLAGMMIEGWESAEGKIGGVQCAACFGEATLPTLLEHRPDCPVGEAVAEGLIDHNGAPLLIRPQDLGPLPQDGIHFFQCQ